MLRDSQSTRMKIWSVENGWRWEITWPSTSVTSGGAQTYEECAAEISKLIKETT